MRKDIATYGGLAIAIGLALFLSSGFIAETIFSESIATIETESFTEALEMLLDASEIANTMHGLLRILSLIIIVAGVVMFAIGGDYLPLLFLPDPPNQPTNESVESATGYGKNYTSVYDVYLNVTVSDPDEDSLDVMFYIDGIHIGTVYAVESGENASFLTSNYNNASYWYNTTAGQWQGRNFFNHSTMYEWHVEISDGVTTTTTGPTWNFNTTANTDVTESGRLFADDLSAVINIYGVRCDIPGIMQEDVTETGRAFADDLSLIIGDFGTRYYGQ